MCTLSRVDHGPGQTREVECTKIVLPQVIDELGTYTYIILYTLYTMLKLHFISAIISRSHHICSLFVHVGVKVMEVAHDHQVCVKKFVTEELGVINSYDTWHGIF